MVDTVVELRHVYKSFNVGLPIETEVLHGIDLTLNRGEFCAVMGPSGSGKSTLLNIVGLLDRPTSGSMSISTEETTTLDDRALTRLRGHNIGFVFQYHYLMPAFTAKENVMMPMLGDTGFPNDAMARRAEQLLESVGLTKWRDSLAGEMSGGQQQRVAVARALANEPSLILADEPTGNLDEKTGDAVVELLLGLCAETKTALILVTHNAAHAAKTNRKTLLHEGKLHDVV